MECSLQFLALGGGVIAKTLQHQDAEVARRSLEFFDIFDEEEDLEHAHGIGVAEVAFGIVDGTLDGTLEGTPDAFKHAIEGGELANRLVVDGHGHLAEYAQHGTLTHGIGLALKTVMQREAANGRLE